MDTNTVAALTHSYEDTHRSIATETDTNFGLHALWWRQTASDQIEKEISLGTARMMNTKLCPAVVDFHTFPGKKLGPTVNRY